MKSLSVVALLSLTAYLSGACTVTGAADAPPPAATLDLMTPEGVSVVQGEWRYKDVELVRVPFQAPGADGQPTGAANETWDTSPHAGIRNFYDRDWPVIEPGAVQQRRGAGRLSFAWYRLELTIPARIGDFETRGANIDFETSIDDYAEVWVDGELPRAFAQSGGSVIKGWNGVNRLTVGRNVQPGQKIQLAIYGINGPLSDPPTNFIWMRLAKLSFYRPEAGAAGPLAVDPQEVNVRVERLDPVMNQIVPPNAKVFKLAEGFQFTEGPIWIREGGYLLFSDPNANRIYSYDPKRAVLAVYREHSGYEGSDISKYSQPGSNGMTVDSKGRLTINQHGNRRIVRLEADGSLTVLAAKYRGKRLNSPNDLVYKSDGSLFFTDPPFGLPKFFRDPRKELSFSGVFRAFNGKITLITDELDGPNGLAFSPAEDYFYVDNWSAQRKVILRFPVKHDGGIGKSEVFVDMSAELPGDEALDGMKIDNQGNLYVAAPDGVRIYSAAGKHLGTVTVPRVVHNLAWGGDDGRTLYLCASDRLYRINVLIPWPASVTAGATGSSAANYAGPIELGRDALGSFADIGRREWLVTNGLGGFAAGTVGLVNTRRYHGLLFAALRPPVERVAMVAKLDITAIYDSARVPLATNEYADGTIAPQGFCQLESFRLEGLIPVWTWLIADMRLEQRLWMRHRANTTYVEFTRIGGSRPLMLSIEPLCTYRDYHWQSRGERAMRVEPISGGVQILAHEGAQSYRLLGPGADVAIEPEWYWNFKHREESARGLDDLEDLLRPAVFRLDLNAGQRRALILTAVASDPLAPTDALSEERARQRELADRFRQSHRVVSPDLELPEINQLALAADHFLVDRHDTSGKALGRTVIAGYPWFSDWGRDTMIALPGLTLVTGQGEIAVSVVRTFARFVSCGMVPNRFPDVGDAPEYNTVDASLWFFVAVQEYLRYTSDSGFAAEIYPTLQDMVEWHVRGTRFAICMDPQDALLRAGEAGVQLTWMDAKVGDWVVTPRIGKPVEINALWHNAVAILRDLAGKLGQVQQQAEYAALATRIRESFEQAYWFEAGGYLYDVVDGPEGECDATGRRRDASLRPNQIFALSLPHALLKGEKARRVLDRCAAELWTPVGLRSLAASDPRYVSHYRGGPLERDGAYHQGTVWTWLIGPFVTAHYRVYGNAAAALEYLRDIPAHLREGCVGQVSEIMDAAAPFAPKGCFAQAWGVAEILRAWAEINDGEHRRRTPQAAGAMSAGNKRKG